MTPIENTDKYGYVITTTPGLLSEGSCPVNRNGYPAKCENDGDYASIVPIYATRAAAEAAMMAMTPEGSTPSTWAGYRVDMAYSAAPLHLAHGMVIGMGGFALA